MARVILRRPDGEKLTLELPGQHALLFGRAPDSRQAFTGTPAEGWPIETVALTDDTVSANHAAIWNEGDAISVLDLSKNGTWLVLRKGQIVQVGGPEVEVQLTQTVHSGGAKDEPAPPNWAGPGDYARAVALSIEQWLAGHGVKIRVRLIAEPNGKDRSRWRLPLATGEALNVEPTETLNVNSAGLLEQLLPWTERQNSSYETEEETRREGMILASPAIRATHREVVAIARGGAHTLLLTGETGSGKEMLAEVFHRHSGRSGPLIPVNCSELKKDRLVADLFGSEVGAFTGGTRRIVGAVERAHGGTLFLDEIGEMDLEVQPMLLRFLDRREYHRLSQLGHVEHADVRVIAATHRDLRDEVRAGTFRDDLRWRISAFVVEVPPLRSRCDDVRAYLDSVRTEDGRTTIREALSPEAIELLRAYPWKGNFRELRNFAERLLHSRHKRPINAELCRRILDPDSTASSAVSTGPSEPASVDWEAQMSRAVQVFKEDHRDELSTWDDQKELLEKYLKPLLFYQMSGAAAHPAPARGDRDGLTALANKCAAKLKADRGTARSQLRLYFERFRT